MFKKMKRKKSQPQTLARKLIAHTNPKSMISEQFKTVRTNINFSMPDKDLKTIVVTSSTPGEGKSTNASNIAVVYAQSGKKVLLVDGDMRKPTTHHTFNIMNTKGLSTVLIRQHTLDEVAHKTDIEGLSIITSGPIPPNPAELIASKTMDQFIETVKGQFDMVIFDAPPVLSVTDAQILSNKCEGTILVINSGKAEKENVIKAKEMLIASKANIIGAVLNNYAIDKNHYYYQYYGAVE
ncbi:CpsD/CapB family tyrosine-protein kinase [Solibacillus isronensis]|uniref:CpsD/CapB family tyrosine-protein kinase n=1 Tax=Solibacillus isronensis TaxID=412383 RepID=UPI0009A7A85C|nr:CpsD/CapB family tyrosine-protein kinase [Solibacillus isronensis]